MLEQLRSCSLEAVQSLVITQYDTMIHNSCGDVGQMGVERGEMLIFSLHRIPGQIREQNI